MREEVVEFNRLELFKHYNQETNPFLYLTTKVDITNIYNNCKNYYASIGYLICLVVNEIDNFKYRFEDNKIYKYARINLNFTEMFADHNIGYYSVDLKDNYDDFIKEYKSIREKFQNNHKSYISNSLGEIWVSCAPWFKITSLMTPFDKKVTVPQFIWDKFEFINDRCYINLTIMVHHGFVDGYHIGLFLDKLNDKIANLDNYL